MQLTSIIRPSLKWRPNDVLQSPQRNLMMIKGITGKILRESCRLKRSFESISVTITNTTSGLSRHDRGLLLALPTLPGNGIQDLWTNRIFVVGFFSWFIAQMLKILTDYMKTRKLDFRSAIRSGGMPSSHSSVCVGVTTSIALQQGLGSALFAVALCFTSIVMYDAAGIRRHAGYQAQILNRLMSDLPPDHPMSDQDMLKEVLGHSRTEVFGGALLGLMVGLFWPN